MKADLAASIHARLSARAKTRGEIFQEVLTRYGIERFLYRLSLTPARDTLWLKGALLFDLWFDVPHRPTRDADFLGFGSADQDALKSVVRDACTIDVPDGMRYERDSIRVREIREDAHYAGLRVTLTGTLKNARVRCSLMLVMATRSMRMKKKIPTFKSDRTAAAFVEKADLTQYDLSGAQLTRFEIKPKDKSINLRLSEELYKAVRTRAARAGLPYQRFIRLTLEQAVAPKQ